MEKMTEHEKLEYIHSTLQDVQNCIEFAKLREPTKLLSHLDEDMINESLTMVKEIQTYREMEREWRNRVI